MLRITKQVVSTHGRSECAPTAISSRAPVGRSIASSAAAAARDTFSTRNDHQAPSTRLSRREHLIEAAVVVTTMQALLGAEEVQAAR